MRQPRNVLESWIEAIQHEGRGVTKWEADFTASLAEQLGERGTLSERQTEILERIYVERT